MPEDIKMDYSIVPSMVVCGHTSAVKPSVYINWIIILDLKGGVNSDYWPDQALTGMDPDDAIVVVSGQTSSGYFASSGVSFGIPSGFLSARKSRILLSLGLLLKMNRAAIRDLFGHQRGAGQRGKDRCLAKL